MFVVKTNLSSELSNSSFYSSRELAKTELLKRAKEIRYRLGVRDFVLSEDSFTFLLGREEKRITHYIQEVGVNS